MIATNRPTAATTETIAIGNRHHGSRLARKVDTGTDAATTDDHPHPGQRSYPACASDPSRPL